MLCSLEAEPKEQRVAAKVVIDATATLPEQTIVVPPGIRVLVVQNGAKEPVSIRVSKACGPDRFSAQITSKATIGGLVPVLPVVPKMEPRPLGKVRTRREGTERKSVASFLD